jgi:Domain of unknown function (DUF4389)
MSLPPPPPPAPPAPSSPEHPLHLTIDEADRQLDRLSSGLRFFWIIPIGIVLAAVNGGTWTWSPPGRTAVVIVGTAGGLLFWGPLLMILFRQKYPRWWFDWNVELLRFQNRVGAYAALLRDEYPSTDEEQAVHLHVPYPDVRRDLNRWLPLVKWFLAIPHYVVLAILWIGGVVAIVIAWFAILFTGRYPSGLFRFVVGLIRWTDRVLAYALLLMTDTYPPFRLAP